MRSFVRGLDRPDSEFLTQISGKAVRAAYQTMRPASSPSTDGSFAHQFREEVVRAAAEVQSAFGALAADARSLAHRGRQKRYADRSGIRRPPHRGQNLRPLHEKATRRSGPHPTHRIGRSRRRGIRTTGTRGTLARRSAEADPPSRGLCTEGLEMVPHNPVQQDGRCGIAQHRWINSNRPGPRKRKISLSCAPCSTPARPAGHG
jgi:hypothetical protein